MSIPVGILLHLLDLELVALLVLLALVLSMFLAEFFVFIMFLKFVTNKFKICHWSSYVQKLKKSCSNLPLI